MSVNFVSIIAKPKITITTNPFLVSSPLLFFSNKTKMKPSILTAFSSMSYDKELAAAKKAASLAARLCQARSLSLPLPVFLCLCTPRGYVVLKLGLFGFFVLCCSLLKDCVGWFRSVRSLFEHDPDAEFVVWVMPSFWKFWNPCIFSFLCGLYLLLLCGGFGGYKVLYLEHDPESWLCFYSCGEFGFYFLVKTLFLVIIFILFREILDGWLKGGKREEMETVEWKACYS